MFGKAKKSQGITYIKLNADRTGNYIALTSKEKNK
jgi:hypothetical protein